MTPDGRELSIYAAIGFSVWLSGAVEVWFAGRHLFESGAGVTLLSAIFIAVGVCWIFRSTMRWRKAPPSQAVTIAVAMALPGLFGEPGRQLLFGWATGLQARTQPAFAATLFFGNTALLAYAMFRQYRAR
ncbi:MAG: DUF5367 family protein [Alphaproteobacteria bacterium]|nr:DUF5367 family protein [Alphaproteobacteria bacterium]